MSVLVAEESSVQTHHVKLNPFHRRRPGNTPGDADIPSHPHHSEGPGPGPFPGPSRSPGLCPGQGPGPGLQKTLEPRALDHVAYTVVFLQFWRKAPGVVGVEGRGVGVLHSYDSAEQRGGAAI